MDFEYNPNEALDDFFSNDLDNIIKQQVCCDETQKLSDLSGVEDVLDKKLVKCKEKQVRTSKKSNKKKSSKTATKETALKDDAEKNIEVNQSEKNDTFESLANCDKIGKKGKAKKARKRRSLDDVDSIQKKKSVCEPKEFEEDAVHENYLPEVPVYSTTTQVGRARRRYFSNLAASLRTTEVIDLVSLSESTTSTNKKKKKKKSTKSKPTNLIVIGSDSGEDSEHEEIQFKSVAPPNDDIYEEDNPSCQILIKWNHQIEKHQIRKYQRFLDIIKHFCNKESVSSNDVLFNLGDKIINENDTVDTIDYKFGDVICGRIVKNQAGSPTLNSSLTKINSDQISFKVQSNAWKKPINIFINKNDTFKILYIQLAETMKINIKNFILKFDGDQLNLHDKPADLDLEGEEIIDCLMKQ